MQKGTISTHYHRYEKNLQGDIVGIFNEAGERLVCYYYDAWGIPYSSCDSEYTWLKDMNPFRYRGYYFDRETYLYYLNSRYYDYRTRRFISADTSDVLTATPMALTDKNLYAYCDNNPVMRRDDSGEFWLVGVVAGLATQYIGDVIGNLIDGKKGIDVLKPTSTAGEYIAAGVTALIPGTGLGGALVRNSVAEGISVAENVILKKEVNVVDSLINVGLGTILDAGFEKASDKVSAFISSKEPQNYSSYAHIARQSNPSLTREQIYRSMQRSIRFNRAVTTTTSAGFDIVRSALPY